MYDFDLPYTHRTPAQPLVGHGLTVYAAFARRHENLIVAHWVPAAGSQHNPLDINANATNRGVAWQLQLTQGTALSLSRPTQGGPMLHYAVVFFVIALIAAVFGFGGIAAGAAQIAKILFFIFIIIAAVTFVMSLLRRS